MDKMDDDDFDDLPPTPFEVEQLRHEKLNRENAKRERHRLRRANQKKGFAEPQPGAVLYVQLDGSISSRTRAGIRFERNKRVEVTVTTDEEYAVERAKNPSAPVVTVEGAERIIEDESLHVFESAMTDADVNELKRKGAELEEELRVTKQENARLQAAIRQARQGAQPSATGQPNRLRAAEAVRRGSPPPDEDGFINPGVADSKPPEKKG